MPYVIKGEAEVQLGFGLPRRTTASIQGYTPPYWGYQVYNMDTKKICTWNGAAWIQSLIPADLDDFVDNQNNQSIAGVKTFTDNLIINDATPVLTLRNGSRKITQSLENSSYVLKLYDVEGTPQNEMTMNANSFVFDGDISGGDYNLLDNGIKRASLTISGGIIKLNRFATDGTTIESGISFGSNSITSTVPVIVPLDSDPLTSVPRSYIDALDVGNLKKTGGDLTGALNTNSTINIDGSLLRFSNSDGSQLEGDLDSNSTSLVLRQHSSAGVGGILSINESNITSSVDLRSSVQGTSNTSVVTIGHANATFVDLNSSQTLSNKTLINPSINNTAASSLTFKFNGTNSGQCIAYSNRFDIRRVGGSALRLSSTSIAATHQVSCSVLTTPSDATGVMTTKSYVDDDENVIQAPAFGSMIMPSVAPTVGQRLECTAYDSTTGVATMSWVTP